MIRVIAALAMLAFANSAEGRGRDLGIPFEGTPGRLDAITDVPGVEVGQVTLISGNGALKVGRGPVRTGVTVVFPRGHGDIRPVAGGFFDLNGNGELTGRSYLEDFNLIYGPIGLTNTNAVGQVYAGIQLWSAEHFGMATWPVVAETWDGYLNDTEGFHVTADTARMALDAARGGPVAEGNVGGGTGMVCFGFKGGIGTASRVVLLGSKSYTVGVLAQCNTGDRKVLRIAGAPVGAELMNRWQRCADPRLAAAKSKLPRCAANGSGGSATPDDGSIIIVVGTDAPLTGDQLNRVARRAAMGLARLGSYSGNQSGDLIVSFSNAIAEVNHPSQTQPSPVVPIPNLVIDALFEGTVEATEEAVVNAMIAARTMSGIDGTTVFALPHDELRAILKRYNRLEERK